MMLGQWFKEIWGPPENIGAGETITRADTAQPMQPRPRLVAVNHAPSRDEFASWRDDPTTQFVFAALRAAALEQKAAWDDVSWHGGEANEKLLTELRTRADAYEAMEAGDYEDFCSWAGVAPEPQARGDNDAA